MAEDIHINITGDSKDLKKVIKTANKLVDRFEKTHKKATSRRVRNEEKASNAIKRGEEQKNRRLVAMDRRLSRRRARIRLRQMKANIAIAKKEARAEERIKKRSQARMRRFNKGLTRGARFGAGAAVAGVAGFLLIAKDIAKYDLALTKMAGTQNLTVKKQMEIRESIMKTSVATGVGRDKILEAVTAIVDKSGDIDLATGNIEQLGKMIAVVGEESAQGIGDLLAALSVAGGAGGVGPMTMFESIVSLGDKANITIEDTARQAKKLIGAFGATGGKGKQDFAEFMALYQSIGGILSPEEATTAVKSFFRDIKKKSTKLGAAGIDIFSDKNKTKLKSTAWIINAVLKKTGGNADKLKALFGDMGEGIQAVFDALNIDMAKNNGAIEDYNRNVKLGVEGAGNIQRKFDRISTTSAMAFAKIGTMFTAILDKALAPAVDDLAEALTKMLQDPAAIQQLTEMFGAIGTAMKWVIKGAGAFHSIGSGLGQIAADLSGSTRTIDLQKRLGDLMQIPKSRRTQGQREDIQEIYVALKGFTHIDKEGNIVSERVVQENPDKGENYTRITQVDINRRKGRTVQVPVNRGIQ